MRLFPVIAGALPFFASARAVSVKVAVRVAVIVRVVAVVGEIASAVRVRVGIAARGVRRLRAGVLLQDHIQIYAAYSVHLRLSANDLVAGDAEFTEFFPQLIKIRAEVQQRTQRHIPAYTGETVEKKDSFHCK
jgi:hypothetical protein